MSTDIEKLILETVKELEKKLDDFIDNTHTINGVQNERLKEVEMRTQSTQNELSEYKKDMNKLLDKRGNSVFQIIGAIASGMTVIGLIITWILLMSKGIV